MKLLLCKACNDVVRLRQHKRYCDCGMSSGHYRDNVNIVKDGPCLLIGIDNSSLSSASQNVDNKNYDKRSLKAFVLYQK